MEFTAYREAMHARLVELDGVGPAVAGAFLAVPRHLFLLDVAPEDAYRDQPIVTKRDDEGRPISSSSQPAIMAIMLGQLDVRPGHRVLEIGAGTGYNAALLDRLAGPGGHVVTVDIDADLVERARRHLAAAGCPRVEVVCGDGADGFAARAPYDRVIATVGVWDLAPAWLAQLAPGGRVVVPLDLRGVQVSVAFEREGDHLTSRTVVPCGFMRMRGPFAGPEVTRMLRGEPQVVITLPEPREIGDVLTALDGPAVDAPTDGPVEPGAAEEAGALAWLGLWLATHEPRWCALTGQLRAAPVRGPGYGMTAGIVEDGSIAVLAEEGRLAARGHGPDGARLAEELAGHVLAWRRAGRPDASGLRIDAYQGPAPDGEAVIAKRHVTLVLSYD
ncbi:methyltransferase, FxLD system [Nonomuraea sp. NPDC000554]|uniref:methyltransferase, FxLD system n=1 Tax=Nonomuraea sp. NPDC000554 TaxID=3154259 RepID=UPI00332AC357